MGEKVESVKLEVKAEDEASGVLEKVGRNLREIALEQRAGGEHQIESLLKGAGVAAMAVEATKIASEISKAGAEAWEGWARGSITGSQAIGHVVEQARDSIPVLGTVSKSFDELFNSISRMEAAHLKAAGASEQEQDAALTAGAMQEKYTEIAKEQKEAIDELRESTEAVALARAKLAGGPEAEALEAEAAHAARLRKLTDDLHKLQSDAGLNPSDDQRQQITAKRQEILNERERFDVEAAKRDKDLRQEREAGEREHAGRLQTIRDEAADARAKGIQSQEQAEAEAIERRAERETAEVLRAAENRKKGKNAEQRGEIDRQATEETLAIQERLAAERSALSARTQREREATEREHEANVARVRGAAAVEGLRNQRRDDEAALLELKNRHDEELAEIDRANTQKLQRLRDTHTPGASRELAEAEQRIAQEKAALDAKYSADVAAAQRQQANRHEDEADQAANELAEARVGLLRAAGEAGNKLAEQDAQRLEIMTRTEAKIAAINRQLREQKDLSPEARADLEKTIGLLRQSEAASLANVGRGDYSEYRAAPGGDAGRGVRGYAAAAATAYESAEQRRYEAQIKQLGLTQQLIEVGRTVADGMQALAASGAGTGAAPSANQLRW